MHASLLSQIKSHPRIFFLSIVVHVVLFIIVMISLNDPSAPKLPAAKKVDTVKAVIIDASVVEQEVQKFKQAEEKKRNQQIAQKDKLDLEAKQAREQRIKEENRLAALKSDEQKRKQEVAKKEKAEREKKNKELANLEKQKKELEDKRKVEQKKLADIEKQRKFAEAEAHKKKLAVEAEAKRKEQEAAAEIKRKKLAAEAEVRRKEQEEEMRQQMLAEEQRMAKQTAENMKLLSRYVYQIQKKVEANWNAPASMTKGWMCEVLVEQNRFGDVLNVQMKKCTGSEAFKSTVERAVRKASPLPEAPNNDVFEKKLNFVFRPEI